jgi:SAM-dependent methyltransferase
LAKCAGKQLFIAKQSSPSGYYGMPLTEPPRPMIPHYWHTLPGPQWFSATRIYAEQVKRADHGAVFVELGCWKGRSTAFMGVEIANSGKCIDFYAVDHWRGSLEERAHEEDEDVRRGRLYETFQTNIRPIENYIRPLRLDSAEAAANFEDRSVDFVYMDAGHTTAAVARDIAAWWPKLKAEGTLAGDDWCYINERCNDLSVRRAVLEFFVPRGIAILVQPGDPNPEREQWLVSKAYACP